MACGPLSECIMSYPSALVPLSDTWVETPNRTDSPADCMHPTVIHCCFQIDCQTRRLRRIFEQDYYFPQEM